MTDGFSNVLGIDPSVLFCLVLISFLLATRMDGHGSGEERCDP